MLSDQSTIKIENGRLLNEHITGIAFRCLLKDVINEAPSYLLHLAVLQRNKNKD